jgi:hypothetical protein
MKRKSIVVLSLITLLLLLLVLWFQAQIKNPSVPAVEEVKSVQEKTGTFPSKDKKPRPLTKEEVEKLQQQKRQEVSEKVTTALNTPVKFYGRVVDQNGTPVPMARIGYGVLNKFNQSGSNYHNFADENGYFEMTEIRGAAVTVTASKEGYYYVPDKSSQSFAYGIGPDTYHKLPPTKENPVLFVLHKMGETENLIRIETGGIKVLKDGTPTILDLDSGKKVKTGVNTIRVEAWTYDQGVETNQPYDWRCRVSVPAGGLVEREKQFNFFAPETGYREFDEVMFDKSQEQWKKNFSKEYFIKFADGKYARMKFWFTSGGEHFFEVESYLNPKTGSRNLEFDPAKQINK